MIDNLVDKILKAEKEAEEIVNKAKEDAQKLLDDKNEEAQEMIKAFSKFLKAKSKAEQKKIEENAEKAFLDTITSANTETAKIESLAKKNMDKAVLLMLQSVK
ncbi:MAG: hypothetical protein FWC82_00660 [Firmicutes bacterium]|nr:hypothetical protein [Bacillota bacterium]